MVISVPVHTGKTALKLALKDIMKPIEITISGRKIATRCFPPRPWQRLHNKANCLEDFMIQDWINNLIIPSWKHKPALVCIHVCNWLDLWVLVWVYMYMREIRLKISFTWHKAATFSFNPWGNDVEVLLSSTVCVCVSLSVCAHVCVKADSLLLSCSSESCRRTLRAQFPQFGPPPQKKRKEKALGGGLVCPGKSGVAMESWRRVFDWGIQSSGPGLF